MNTATPNNPTASAGPNSAKRISDYRVAVKYPNEAGYRCYYGAEGLDTALAKARNLLSTRRGEDCKVVIIRLADKTIINSL